MSLLGLNGVIGGKTSSFVKLLLDTDSFSEEELTSSNMPSWFSDASESGQDDSFACGSPSSLSFFSE
mgnify:CR=1 FL=1